MRPVTVCVLGVELFAGALYVISYVIVNYYYYVSQKYQTFYHSPKRHLDFS
jgi:hypothetical protein